MLRIVLTAIVVLVTAAVGTARPVWPTPEAPVDLVRVLKAERELQLWRGGAVIASYRISLGRNPLGHKRQERDGRTPEALQAGLAQG